MSHILYRFYARWGELLYVGITMNVADRWRDHREGKVWWPDVGVITVRHYNTRQELLDAERTAIQTEHPTHNVRHSTRWWDWSGTAPKQVPRYTCACGREAFYYREIGRFFHVDGTDNWSCWCAVARGDHVIDVRLTVEVPLP